MQNIISQTIPRRSSCGGGGLCTYLFIHLFIVILTLRVYNEAVICTYVALSLIVQAPDAVARQRQLVLYRSRNIPLVDVQPERHRFAQPGFGGSGPETATLHRK